MGARGGGHGSGRGVVREAGVGDSPPPSVLSANIFQIYSVLEIGSVPPGREVWTSWMDVTCSGGRPSRDCLPTTGYPEVPARELESGKLINPWNTQREMGQSCMHQCASREMMLFIGT